LVFEFLFLVLCPLFFVLEALGELSFVSGE